MMRKFGILISMAALLFAFVGCNDDDEAVEYTAQVSVSGVDDASHASAFKFSANGESVSFTEADFSAGTLSGEIPDLLGDVEITLTVDNEAVAAGAYEIDAAKITVNADIKTAAFMVTFTEEGGGEPSDASLVLNYNFANDMQDWTPREGTDDRWRFVDSPNGSGRTLEYEGGDGRDLLEFTSAPILDVEVGAEYSITIVAQVIDGYNGGANFKLRAWDVDDGFLGEEWMNFPQEPTDGFQEFTNTMIIPEGTHHLDVLMAMFDGDGPTGIIQVDEVIVKKVELPTGENSLLLNANFANDMENWTPREGTDDRWSFIDSPNGTDYGRTLEYEGGDGRDILEFTSDPITDVEVGAEYSITIVAKVVDGYNGGANFKLRAWDVDENFLGEEWMNFPTEPTNGFQQFTNTMTIPANTHGLDVLLAMFDGDGSTGIIQVDVVVVEKVQ